MFRISCFLDCDLKTKVCTKLCFLFTITPWQTAVNIHPGKNPFSFKPFPTGWTGFSQILLSKKSAVWCAAGAERDAQAAQGLTCSWKSRAEWKSATIFKAVYKWMESSVTYFSEWLRGLLVLGPSEWCDVICHLRCNCSKRGRVHRQSCITQDLT